MLFFSKICINVHLRYRNYRNHTNPTSTCSTYNAQIANHIDEQYLSSTNSWFLNETWKRSSETRDEWWKVAVFRYLVSSKTQSSSRQAPKPLVIISFGSKLPVTEPLGSNLNAHNRIRYAGSTWRHFSGNTACTPGSVSTFAAGNANLWHVILASPPLHRFLPPTLLPRA